MIKLFRYLRKKDWLFICISLCFIVFQVWLDIRLPDYMAEITTLINLLMKFYELNEGEIIIDGTPISGLKRSGVHEAFCMVLQDTWLFEGSIKGNG